MNDIITALNNQIRQLNEKRNMLIKEERKNHEDQILSYEWLKGVEFTFEEGISPYAGAEWCLLFYSDYDPLKHVMVTSMILEGAEPGSPEHGCHSQCLTLSRAEFGYKIHTCDPYLFIDFIKKINAKIKMPSSLHDHLRIYTFLKEYCYVDKPKRYNSQKH